MNQTALVTSEKKSNLPILVVDKEGKIGEALVNELKNESLVVYVSNKPPKEQGNIVHIPFIRKIPTIPDNQYSYAFIVDENIQLANELVEEFIKKSIKDNTSLSLIIGLNSSTKKFMNNHINIYEKVKIIVFGEIFKKDAVYNHNSNIDKYILQANVKQRMVIPGDGTRKIYPVFFDDLIQGILEAAFGGFDNQKIIYLFPKHGITLLSLANIFKKKDPDLKIDFSKKIDHDKETLLPVVNGEYLLGDDYKLEDKLKTVEVGNSSEEVNKDKELVNLSAKSGTTIYSFKILFLLMLFLILLPLISTLLFSLAGFGSLYMVRNDVKKGEILFSKNFASIASGCFAIAGNSALVLTEEARLIGQEERVSGLVNSINSAGEISVSALSLIDAAGKFKSVLSGEAHDPVSNFSDAAIELKNALYIYNKEEQAGNIPKEISHRFVDSIKLVSSTVDFWQDMFGFNGTRTYLVLFENNMELRPGGGFIGSYAIGTVNKGRLISFNIYDVYDADGQLKGHIEPPYPIRRYLPSAHWFLRDSNFNVDFSKGAISSALFLNTEMHQAVDGVIGVDLSFVKNILSIIGPVRVTDYNQVVTADNFFQVAQSHAEKDFFPSSTQKKDFLKSFYNSLKLKVSETKNIPYLSLMEIVTKSIYEKHILFAFNNSSEQAAYSVNGWSSALVDERQINQDVVNDFMGINEANIGGNKNNYYVSRSVSQNVTVNNNGNIEEDLVIDIKNSAPSGLGTAGIYKNYLRFILPLNASLNSVQIDGKEQKMIAAVTDPAIYEKKGFVLPDGLEVQKEDGQQNTIYGFLINIQPQETKSIKINYVLGQTVNILHPEISYNLKIFKQPGVDLYSYNLSFNFPNNFKILNSSSDVATTSNSSLLSTQITRDREVFVNLAAK
jgi:hypothetical protein